MRFRPTYRNIWGISFPIILAGISETIVDITDTIFLAHYGVTELAAIGVADAIYGLALFLTLGLVDGIQIIIGRRAGQEQPGEIGHVFNQGLYLLTLSAVMMISIIIFVMPGATMYIFASENVHGAVNTYLRITAFALLFQSFNLAYSAFYIGISRTRVLIGAAVVLAITNITLDYGLIFGYLGLPELGIQGAAIASLVAEIATFIFLTLDIARQRYSSLYGLFHFTKWNVALSWHLLKISMPVSLDALVDMAKWFLLIMIIEQLGEEILASANIIFSCYALFLISVDSFSETVCSMISNLIGQQQRQQLNVLIRRTIKLSYVVVTPMLLLTWLFPEYVLTIFTEDINMIETSHNGLLMIVLATLIAVPADAYYSAVAGTGDTRVTLLIQSFVAIFTLVFAWYAALVFNWELEYILLAEMLGWLVCLCLSWAWFKSGLWDRLKV
jgi:putative MATE family efflux protein